MKGMWKKIVLFVFTLFVLFSHVTANAVTCFPRWEWSRTVEANCTFPAWWYKIYGDVIIGDNTITLPTWSVMWVDLINQKITFTTWKIMLEGTAKIDDTVSNRYYVTQSYSKWTSNPGPTVTECPAGTQLLNDTHTGFLTSTKVYVSENGTMDCAKP